MRYGVWPWLMSVEFDEVMWWNFSSVVCDLLC